MEPLLPMHGHGPKRLYSPQSLESWFQRLERDWALRFSPEHLEFGRRLYRSGEVREIELTESDAIVHRRVDKRDEYSVIEWKNGEFSVRSSAPDEAHGRGLAVAGLYEIEELVADELSPLPVMSGSSSSNGSRPERREVARNQGNPRPLALRFDIADDGLVFRAFWLEESGDRIPALGHNDKDAHPRHSDERSRLIGLAALARKAHFRYQQEEHAYIMDVVADIPEFLKNHLPVWRKSFRVEEEPAVDSLARGVQTVELEGNVERRGDGGLDLRWIFRAGERLLQPEEVELLARSQGEAVLLPGLGILRLNADEWRRVCVLSRNKASMSPVDLRPYLLFSLFNDDRLRLTLTPEVEAWRRSVLESKPLEKPQPEFLRAYQQRGVAWMHHLCESGCHGLLADEMGLGKTLQVATLLQLRPLAGLRHLIVCPASVVPVWVEEINRFFPGTRMEVLKSGNDFNARSEPLLWIASYAQLRKHRDMLADVEFGYAVLDEGQFIKNPEAKVTQACFEIQARHRLVLTGTPLENRHLDLWSIFNFLLPGLLGDRSAFETAVASDPSGAIDLLRRQVAPFILRRTKNEVAGELPPKVDMDLHCPLTDRQRSEYARICTEGLARLGDDIGAAMREKSFGLLSLLTRLRQICCDPDLVPWIRCDIDESGKINLLVEKLTEIFAGGHKVVIFSQFVSLLKRVRIAFDRHFPDLPRFELTGVTQDRLKPVQQFQSAGEPAAMLVSLKAAGTGITLHAADYVFLLDPWWNPAVEEQAVDRVHRLGQTNTVFVYRMVTAGTIEERIQALKADKQSLFNQVVGVTEGDFDLSKHFSDLRTLIDLVAADEPDVT